MRNRITVSVARITALLTVIAILLVLASIAGQLIFHLTTHDTAFGMIRLFNVDTENNVPTYFSALLLLTSALLIGIIAVLERRDSSDFFYWIGLSAGFVLMAADEALSFHEKLISPVQNLLAWERLGIFYFAWIVPGIILVLLLGLVFLRFWWRLPPATRFNFLVAGLFYLGGAIGIEAFGGWYAETFGGDLLYSMIATLEESLEMTGSILFIRALLLFIAEQYREVEFQITGGKEMAFASIREGAQSKTAAQQTVWQTSLKKEGHG
ncbi:MAG TPA: hypothetical protein VKZ59_14715 [Acidobacteriota bacterium]|nr:hypothetical protein [Acidobacteriota bacterium]